MAGLVFQNLIAISVATAANNASTAILSAADNALSALVERQSAVRGFAVTGDKSFPPRIAGFRDDFGKAVDRLDALAPDDAFKAQVAALRQEADKVAQEQDARSPCGRIRRCAAEIPDSILNKGRLTETRRIIKAIADPQRALVEHPRRAAGQGAGLGQDGPGGRRGGPVCCWPCCSAGSSPGRSPTRWRP